MIHYATSWSPFGKSGSNGAIHIEKDKTWSVTFNGNGDDPQEWFENVQNGYMGHMNETLRRIADLVNVSLNISNVNSFLNVLVPDKGLRIPLRAINEISNKINGNRISNAYDIWNLTTQVLTERAQEQPEESFRYLRFGGAIGDVLSDPDFGGDIECNECGTPVARANKNK